MEAYPDYQPIASFSAFNYRRFLILAVAIRAYFDGSGKSDDPECQYLTLAGCIGTPEAWEKFEKRWHDALVRNSCDYLHMKDANYLTGDFSEEKGWTHLRVMELLLDVANNCFAAMAPEHDGTFVGTHCTVNLADYRRAVAVYPRLGNYRPEQFCATHVVNVAASMLPDDSSRPLGKDGTAELYFDKSESFMKHVYKMWTAKGRRKRDANIDLISHVGPVDSKTVYGIQAADFLAWNVNRYFVTKESMNAFIGLHVVPNVAPMYMDFDKFIAAAEEEWPS